MRKKTGFMSWSVLLLIFVLVLSTGFTTAPAAADPDNHSKARLIVLFDDDAGKKSAADYVEGKGGRVIRNFKMVPGMVVSLGDDRIPGLRGLKGVKEVGFDTKVYASDAELDNSWGVRHIGAGETHNSGNKGQGVKVAVIDTGIDYTHPDLDGNYGGGFDYINNDSDPMDDNGHGTHVAGTIAAEDNDDGVVGVAPQAQLYALKVLDANGSGYFSDVISAVEWCISNGIDVMNLSLSGTSEAPGLHEAFTSAYNAGIVVVAAAGNSGKYNGKGDNIGYPARYEEVIAVGATDSSNYRAYFSSTGPALELAAPGVGITSCYLNHSYASASGTSMASPHAAGTAALVLSSGVASGQAVRTYLQQTADDLGISGRDTLYGFGLVDAEEGLFAQPDPGNIIGTVTDENSAPVPGATVTAGEYTATTGENGAYNLPGLPVCSYMVSASKAGYQTASLPVTVGSGETIVANLMLTVIPAPPPAGAISGTITDSATGQPVQNAAIIAGTYSTTSGTDGKYTILEVFPDNYTIVVSAPGYSDASQVATVVSGETSTVNFSLLPLPAASDTVTVDAISYALSPNNRHLNVYVQLSAAAGEPVSGAAVTVAVSLNGQTYSTLSGISDSGGTVTYKIPNAPAGTYTTLVDNVTASGYTWDSTTPENIFIKTK